MAQSLLLSSAANDEAAQKQEKGEQLMTKYEHEEEEDEDDNPPGPFIWIIAHSNVAVKNVAEKLVKIGLLQFKLMVSEEFHFEWCVVYSSLSFFSLPLGTKTCIMG